MQLPLHSSSSKHKDSADSQNKLKSLVIRGTENKFDLCLSWTLSSQSRPMIPPHRLPAAINAPSMHTAPSSSAHSEYVYFPDVSIKKNQTAPNSTRTDRPARLGKVAARSQLFSPGWCRQARPLCLWSARGQRGQRSPLQVVTSTDHLQSQVINIPRSQTREAWECISWSGGPIPR